MDPVNTQYQIKSAMYISHAQCLRAIMQKITRNVCTVYTVNIDKYGITDVHCHQCHCIVKPSLYPNVGGAIASRVSHLVSHCWTSRLGAKIDAKILVQSKTTFLCIHVHLHHCRSVPV